jgi:hypothetical protein
MSKTITKVIAGLGIVAGLGVAALPLTSYAASENVAVSFKVNPTLSGNEAICTTASGNAAGIAAGATDTATCTAVYSANAGASISIVDQDSNNSLVGTASSSNTIAAISTPAASLTGEQWGFKFEATQAGAGSGGLTAVGGFANYNAVPVSGSAATVGSSTAPTTLAEGTFTFGVSTATTTVADTYTDTVVIAITPTP